MYMSMCRRPCHSAEGALNLSLESFFSFPKRALSPFVLSLQIVDAYDNVIILGVQKHLAHP